MITQRYALTVGLAVSALCFAIGPASAVSGAADSVGKPAVGTSSTGSAAAVEGGAVNSDATLVGAATTFLLLGFGSAAVAHRRRWRSTGPAVAVDSPNAAPKLTSV